MLNLKKMFFVVLLIVILPLLVLASSKPFKPVITTKTIVEKTVINGQSIKYRTTVGVLPIKNSKAKIVAYMSYVAYIKIGMKNQQKRPLTFLFNGGPGSSSLDIDFLGMGPKIVKIGLNGNEKPSLVPNNDSWLPYTDEVYIDMVGTGWSKAIDKKTKQEFWGFQGDIDSFTEFIHEYLRQNPARFISPLFIAGESYGGMRAPGIAKQLHAKYNIPTKGLILISPYMNALSLYVMRGSNLPYILAVPSMTATALYYHKLAPGLEKAPLKTLRQAEKWTTNKYWQALFFYDSLNKKQRQQLIQNFHKYTGIPESVIVKHNCRLTLDTFLKELFGKRLQKLGILDSRFSQRYLSLSGANIEAINDALLNTTGLTSNPSIMHYLHYVIGIKASVPYIIGDSRAEKYWQRHEDIAELEAPQALDDLHDVLVTNKKLKVFIASGYYDLCVPYLGQIYDINQLQLMSKESSRIKQHFFWAGHMMYVDQKSRKKLASKVKKFIDDSLAN